MIGLEDFDPHVIAECGLTVEDLERVIRYIRLLQGEDALTLRDIAVGGYYGTSALLHEVIELRILLARDANLLGKSQAAVSRFFFENLDAHAQGLAAEYGYLREKIKTLWGEDVSIGALVLSNATPDDLYLLVESAIPLPVFEPTELEIDRAKRFITRLRELGKEM